MIPPIVGNACDSVLQFKFIIADSPGKITTAAEFAVGREIRILNKNEQSNLKIKQGVTRQPIEVNIESSGTT